MLNQCCDDAHYNFALATDDGGGSKLYGDADVLILGLPGIGKSTICRVLARLGFFAANMPIVQDALNGVNWESIAEQKTPVLIGLLCNRNEIIKRRNFSGKLNGHPKLNPLIDVNIVREIQALMRFFDKIKCERIDVSCISPLEAAEYIKPMITAPTKPNTPTWKGSTFKSNFL